MIVEVGRVRVGRVLLLGIILAVLVLASVALALTTSQGTPPRSEGTACLLGTYTAERETTLLDPVTGMKYKVLVEVTLNVTRNPKGGFTVTVTTTLTPKGVSKASIMFTPPLTDMVVRTDAGTFRWSEGKYFIQAIISRELPLTDKIGMNVKGTCVKYVSVEVRPLRTSVEFGSGHPETTPQQPQGTPGRLTGLIVLVTHNGSIKILRIAKPVKGVAMEGYRARNVTIPCNLVVGGIRVSNVTLQLYVPEGISDKELRNALQPLIAACSGNMSGLKGVAIIIAGEGGVSNLLRGVYGAYAVKGAVILVSGTSTHHQASSPTTTPTATMVTVATTRSPHSTSSATTATPTIPTVATVSPSVTSSPAEEVWGSSTGAVTTPLTPNVASRTTAAALALGAALAAGLIAYVIIVRKV